MSSHVSNAEKALVETPPKKTRQEQENIQSMLRPLVITKPYRGQGR